MSNKLILITTALAPIIWGSSYIVTTEYLPQGYPLTLAVLRALPVGLLLLMLCRQLPSANWWLKIVILGALNFSIFWWLLFVSAYRLPGGVAATIGAIQPLLVLFLARGFLGSQIHIYSIAAAVSGVFGVALLLLTAIMPLDKIGLLAGVGGAISMAFGTVLSKKWLSENKQHSVSPLTFTAWQLVAGGILLLPAAVILEPALPNLSNENIFGLIYLGLVGAGLTYLLWFRGLAKLSPNAIAPLGFLSPVTAVFLGWIVLGQSLSVLQFAGAAIIFFSIWLSQRKPQQTLLQPGSNAHKRYS
ncbi:MAG: putative blue pigment (indigoidine) exporter [Oceanospirillaceae bacterium]|jgi:probable blue pigment (indigoidine) exporter